MKKIQEENPSQSLSEMEIFAEKQHDKETLKQILQGLSKGYCSSVMHDHANDEWMSAVQTGMELNTYFRRLNAGNRMLAVELLRQLAVVQGSQEAMPIEKR
ncbi:hypothetical protein [Rhizobium sp. FKY42]|uniref:hypothetical protein n=1 Tax=Rhizobium sp. FKY42 TaxID=2562310 RepID=UPI0010C0A36A|nr:hypothetical protein [Rhizobium sp. FKY42]